MKIYSLNSLCAYQETALHCCQFAHHLEIERRSFYAHLFKKVAPLLLRLSLFHLPLFPVPQFREFECRSFNYRTKFSLFDTHVACILNYESEVWGFHKGTEIEKIQQEADKKAEGKGEAGGH